MRANSPKIVFFIIDYSFGGGVERVTADLISSFQKAGLDAFHLVSLYCSQDLPKITFPENLSIEVLKPLNKKYIEAEVYKYLKNVKPDILIFQGDNMTISLAVQSAAKRAGVKAIPQYHGSPFAYLKKYPDAEQHHLAKFALAKLVFPFKKNKLKKFVENSKNGLVCVSEGSANELRNLFKGESFLKNLKTIHNPILTDFSSFKGKKNIVNFVSRLESKHKNAFLVLKVWGIVGKKFPDWQLEIYGDGLLKEKFEKFISEKKLKNVTLNGFVKNVREKIAEGAISVSTSNSEGFSMAVAEAISAGNAVAVTDSDGGVSDMVIHNKTGLVSPKNNAENFAENIILLIENETLREQLAVAAQENLKIIISENTVELWEELF